MLTGPGPHARLQYSKQDSAGRLMLDSAGIWFAAFGVAPLKHIVMSPAGQGESDDA